METRKKRLLIENIRKSFLNSQSSDNKIESSSLVSVISVQGKNADSTQHIREQYRYLESLVAKTLTELTQSLSLTFSLDKINFGHFKEIILPILISSMAYTVGEYATKGLSQTITDSEDYDFVFKFIIGSAVMSYSSTQRLTEKKIISRLRFSVVAASELLAEFYLYSASFAGGRKMLMGMLPNRYSLLFNLAASTLVIPAIISYSAEKYQQISLKLQYKHGAQRSDTSLISSGLTPISNTYLLANRLLTKEVTTVARSFQLGLIANNILNDRGLSRQLRNLPAVLIDIIPQIMRKLFVQFKKIENDFVNNTSIHYILQKTQNENKLIPVNRYELRSGDLVWCGNNFDNASAPLSGEIFSFKRNEANEFSEDLLEDQEFRVNLKMYTGENIWLKCKTKNILQTGFKEVDQRAIQDSKQLGILDGAEIDFCGHPENFFVRVARKKEIILDSSFEKKSMINKIIDQYKQTNILRAIALSAAMGLYLGEDGLGKFTTSVRLLFSLFQMMIPFSESFLREMINSKMLKELNNQLSNMPFESVDALRIVDMCNVLGGYYPDKFPKGVIIVSDKTGTLTTLTMQVNGFWTKTMPAHVQIPRVPNQESKPLNFLPQDVKEQQDSFETFCFVFTDSQKELEPEEHAILNQFKQLLKDNDCLNVERVSSNHFIKTFKLNDKKKSVETVHLGLLKTFGGRLTLVSDHNDKYLVYCGIPKGNKFNNTELLTDYDKMNMRTGILSRDWCVAKTVITPELYSKLFTAFSAGDKQEIEKIIGLEIFKNLKHVCTFLIDNPVKDGVQDFIPNCSHVGVPVLVATGDTAKAAENIAKVLCPTHIKNIYTIKSYEESNNNVALFSELNFENATVVFAGVNDSILRQLDLLMIKENDHRPNIIFAEMSTKGKGVLAKHLKRKGYFVVANGDGTNDIAMMKVADFVIAHLSKDGSYAPGVSQYANLNDTQLRKLNHSSDSFYNLFDIHRQQNSSFIRPFIRLGNAQEMVSYALIFKTVKIGFELTKSLSLIDVEEIPYQHLLSIGFDLLWLWITFKKINQHANLPVNSEHIGRSRLADKCMLLTLALATTESLFCYSALGTTTNVTFMLLMLSFLPTMLTSFFSRYSNVEREMSDLSKVNLSSQRVTLFAQSNQKANVVYLQDDSLALVERRHI